MKTLKNLLLISLFALVFVPKAHALVCEEAEALNGPEACYTKVTLSSLETALVSQGTALVYEIDALTPKQGGYQVIRSTASTDAVRLAGFAQSTIASGNSALIMVRGFGFVRTVGGVASIDSLHVTTSGNVGVVSFNSLIAGNNAYASTDTNAIALATSTTNGTTARQAFITVI